MRALAEDLGEGDVTAQLISAEHHSEATLVCREAGILAGSDWFNQAFLQLSPSIEINWHFRDAAPVKANDILCTLRGNTRAMLSAERTALNFLQTLSGTATVTRHYVDLISSTGCKILDTRKTIPGLRLAQKYAVSCGGGCNHRIGLYDAILIKENHIIAAGSLQQAVTVMREKFPALKIETEVESLTELRQALDIGVDRVLLDNFDLNMLAQAVKINLALSHKIELEASGGVTEKTLLPIAQTGVDYISVGAITKNLSALDLSLRISL